MGDRKPRTRKSNSEGSSSSSSSTSSFSSDEETDARDLKPIRGYLSNRRELARQLFRSVKTEKIRMMLPQILKNMNLSDLEEWCASELCGMSEARILAIVNGQPMLDSSDTSESDDSGPSLEIISDTEEWLTDTDVPIKEEPLSSRGGNRAKKIKATKGTKRKNPLGKKSEMEKQRAKARGKAIGGAAIESDVKVKKEKEKDNQRAAATATATATTTATTNKEGESLLDLLELEMRARAIRALIRKEEDIIPSAASEKRMAMTANALRNTLNSAVSASLSSEKSLNGKFSLGDSTATAAAAGNGEKKSSAEPRTTEIVEDEDVVFVVAKPTPTIELLSSDNDEEENGNQETKRDKRQEASANATIHAETANARHNKNPDKTAEVATSRGDGATTSNERIVTIDKSGDGPDNLKIVITKRVSESSPKSLSPGKSGKSKRSPGDRTAAAAETEQSGKGLFKKIKRKQHLRGKRKPITEDSGNDRETAEESTDVACTNETSEMSSESKTAPEASIVKLEAAEIQEPRAAAAAAAAAVATNVENEREAKRKAKRRITMDEDRLDDFEEIIDLDNYSDDMDDMENNCEVKSTNGDADTARLAPVVDAERKSSGTQEDAQVAKEQQSETSSETWATRYYQTDDVQNVIKESKIQSEIRKRLRERQRQSKLGSSPKPNSPGDATVATDKTEEKIEAKPTGSVQEYLALKSATAPTSGGNATDVISDASVAGEEKNLQADTSDLGDEKSTTLPGELVVAAPPSTSDSSQETATDVVSIATTEVQ